MRKNFTELAEEIAGYKRDKQYAICVQKMDEYERDATEPLLRAIILTAKATCASQIDDIVTAEHALSRIALAALPNDMQAYVNLVKASVAQSGRRLLEADLLLSSVIETLPDSPGEERDLLYEALARKGFIRADLNRFSEALELLRKAEKLVPDGEFRESISLYRGYCLQALGDLEGAERVVTALVAHSHKEMERDAYYRLGAIQLQRKDFVAARKSFHAALASTTSTGIRDSDILHALREIDDQL